MTFNPRPDEEAVDALTPADPTKSAPIGNVEVRIAQGVSAKVGIDYDGDRAIVTVESIASTGPDDGEEGYR